ncbi:F-box/kelch-repeat protein At3g06240-like [Prosopis cineraria]|uniref:F-box/kelch-repeat protein At3g06240-like n=1 Tax=Prosopis cineraria TaxID=364024 RepID=UPI00240F6ADB|nr:F-box/kelch-repeat protein At3g06240-like [Prosopis cineraria]
MCMQKLEKSLQDSIFHRPCCINSLTPVNIFYSCKDWLCLEFTDRDDDNDDDEDMAPNNPLLLWNPTTREVKHVPGNSIVKSNGHSYIGFGFSLRVKDYKIVRIHVDELNEKVDGVEVYSMSTNLWKEIGFVKDLDNVTMNSSTITVGGEMEWYGWKREREDKQEDNYDMMVKFDIASEKFSVSYEPDLSARLLFHNYIRLSARGMRSLSC